MLKPGTRIQLQDDGEGWFRGASPILYGVVTEHLAVETDASSPWYVLQLSEPLEFQQSGHNTPSGLRLVRFARVMVRSRWQGVDIQALVQVSVFLILLPEEADPAARIKSVVKPDAWARASLSSSLGQDDHGCREGHR